MQFVVVSVIAGLIGTTGMTAALWLIHRSGWANADMVRALGSAITRSYETALGPGLAIHFSVGIPFAMLYILALGSLPVWDAPSAVLFGGVIGFAHGFAVAWLIGILAEHHPVAEFREAGLKVALAHLFGHVLYGLLVGLTAGASGYLTAA